MDTNEQIDFSDPFEFFLNLDDVNDKNTSKETREAIAEERQQYAAEKRASKENFVDYEAEEQEQYEAPDFDLDATNPQWEDEILGDEESETEESENETDFDDSDDSDGVEIHYEDVDFDTVVALPDGREFAIEELANSYKSNEELAAEKAAFEAERSQFIADKEAAKAVIDIKQLECDKVINDYATFDWDWHAINDPQGYIDNKRYYERHLKMRDDLIAQHEIIQAEKQQQEQAAFAAKSAACVQVLKHEIPDWNESKYGDLLEFAVAHCGANEEEALKWNDPSVFIAMNLARNAYYNIQKVQAKLKRPKVAGKYVSSNRSTAPANNADMQRKQAEKAYASGKMSQEQAFSFLED